MLFIGITGEAGAGKSRVMDYLSKKERVFILYSDDFAKKLSMPGEECYEAIRKAFPQDFLYEDDGNMNRSEFSKLVFKDKEKKALLESCIHPVVKKRILLDVEEKKKSGLLTSISLRLRFFSRKAMTGSVMRSGMSLRMKRREEKGFLNVVIQLRR
ncbi:MAG: dephospho-CoA kinase [Lachnospiraceae bacterium]|nr:dephospho-CoA kinase [Lachnospiraceae bacterium]